MLDLDSDNCILNFNLESMANNLALAEKQFKPMVEMAKKHGIDIEVQYGMISYVV